MCVRIVLGERKRCSPICRIDRSVASSRRTVSSASVGGSSSSPLSARALAVASSHRELVGQRGDAPRVREFGERLSCLAHRRFGLVQTSAPPADAGKEGEHPRVIDGRDLVSEEVLCVGELVLGVCELALACQHGTEGGGRIRAEPAATGADAADYRLRLLGVASGGRQPPALTGDECESRAGNRVARCSILGGGVHEHAECSLPCLVEVAREVESARVGGKGGGQELVRALLGEVHRAAAVEYRRPTPASAVSARTSPIATSR